MPTSSAEYYEKVTAQDITAIAKLLLPGRITVDGGETLACSCPNHASASKKSLHVSKTTQMWYCFGCGIGGDILHLVEFVQSGQVSRAASGAKMGSAHRSARDWLAAQIGLEPLGMFGKTDDERQRIENSRAEKDAIFGVLTDLATYYHDALFAAENASVLQWVRSQWSITDETLHALRIGYAAPDGKPVAYLTAKNHDEATIAHTGAFSVTGQDGLFPFFRGRLIFPYWSRGQVNFMIGRRTPWSEASPYEHAKYKKLPVYAPGGKHACISRHVRNVLFNEDVLLGSPPPPYIAITEGVTDCIALMQAGIPALSPVTVHFKDGELDPLADRLRATPVYLAMDNELSGIGFNAALETARTLVGRGVEARVVVVPLSDAQFSARTALYERFGIRPGDEPAERKRLLEGRTDAEKQEADALAEAAKQDVASWFAAGGTREAFEALFPESKSPLQYFIDNAIGAARIGASLSGTVKTLIGEIAHLSAVDQAMYLGQIVAACKRCHPTAGLSSPVLKIQLKAANTALARRRHNESIQALKDGLADGSTAIQSGYTGPATARGLIMATLMSTKNDHAAAAQVWFQHLLEQGAQPYFTPEKEPFLNLGATSYWVESSGRGRSREWKAFVQGQTGISIATTGGREFFDTLASLVFSSGKVRERFSWLHTDLAAYTIWFHLHNSRDEILKISPDGIEVQINGNNSDGIILDGSPKLLPIEYMPDVDLQEANDTFAARICNQLTCDDNGKLLVSQWLRAFLLIDFAGTRPMTRFEGRAGSGKTTAAKLIGTLIYGEPQHKTGTAAANYSDGARNPLVFLDNIESEQQDEAMMNFLVTTITGISKEKRKAGTESETVIERANCLINTTGIEPLVAKGEVLSRTFTVNFELPPDVTSFVESDAIGAVRRERNILLSGIFKATQLALCEMRYHGALSRVMQQISSALPGHGKSRCNDYLALMYLTAIIYEDGMDVTPETSSLPDAIHPEFLELIKSLNADSADLAQCSNPIAAALHALFRAYATASDIDGKTPEKIPGRGALDQFATDYQVTFSSVFKTNPLSSGQLLTALSVAARRFSINFPHKSPNVLSCRLSNDDKVLRDAGFDVAVTDARNSHAKRKLYTITLMNPPETALTRNREAEMPF